MCIRDSGHPIPRRVEDLQLISGRPLTEAPLGQARRIIMVLDDREDLLREMSRVGLKPQATVTVLGRSDDTWQVQVGELEVPLAADMARRVFVGTRAIDINSAKSN